MKKKSATVIDLGIGNLFSIVSALEHLSIDVKVASDLETIKNSENIILPGDGAFSYAMMKLKEKNLVKFLKDISKTNKRLLGICVGMQVLFSNSEEYSLTDGLNILEGEIKKIPNKNITNNNLIDIPHMGWGPLSFNKLDEKNSFIKNLKNNDEVYFIHSYRVLAKNKSDIIASCFYEGHEITAIVEKANIFACQFHPEKSGQVGLQILKNFFHI